MKLLSVFLSIAISAASLAAEEKKLDYGRWQSPKVVPELSRGYLLFVFALIAASIVLVVWLAKKWQCCRFASSRRLILKESLYLGNKTFLHAVEIDGRLVVLGVGPHPIQVVSESVPAESPAGDSATSFSQLLHAASLPGATTQPVATASGPSEAERAI